MEGASPDEATHTLILTFSDDANYTLSIDAEDSYADRAGNKVASINPGTSVTPWEFTVDKTNPEIAIKAAGKTWGTKFLEFLTFGIWKNDSVTVKFEPDDETSPYIVEYYKSNTTSLITEEVLKNLADDEWTLITEFPIPDQSEFKNPIEPDELCAVYVRITDYAGNRIYRNSDGIIVEKTKPAVTITPVSAPSGVHHEEGKDDADIYNGDVDVKITVNDQAPYSGIRKIEYWIESAGAETKREVLYDFVYTETDQENQKGTLSIKDMSTGSSEYTDPETVELTYDKLLSQWEHTITVDAAANNSCDVKVKVKVTDNAGNVMTEEIPLDIDITPPTITLAYDNNAVKTVVGSRGYFPAVRTATIEVTERTAHFDAAAATGAINIKALNAKEIAVADTAAMAGLKKENWKDEEGASPDEAAHTLVLTFRDDANYTLSIDAEGSYADRAGNRVASINPGTSVTPWEFTVDKTNPEIAIKAADKTWGAKFLEFLTFGIWKNDSVTVKFEPDDETSPYIVEYYKSDETSLITEDVLKNLADDEWTLITEFPIPDQSEFKNPIEPDELCAVYVRITDYCGFLKHESIWRTIDMKRLSIHWTRCKRFFLMRWRHMI